MVQLAFRFLSQNSFFQSISHETQGRLLRRNLPQLSVVILAMFFSPERQSFRCAGAGGEVKDDDDGKLQVGLLARRHQTATAAQTAAQLQPGDQEMSAQSTPRPHCHRIHLSGQEKY